MLKEFAKPVARLWCRPCLRWSDNVSATWKDGIIQFDRRFLCWYRVTAYVACTTTGQPVAFVDPNQLRAAGLIKAP